MNRTFVSTGRNKVVQLDVGRPGDFGHRQGAGRPIVRIHLLGSMRATTYLGENILPRGKKARAILGCLCLAPGERIPRSRLAALLWDRVPDAQSRTSFRQALRELSAALGTMMHELISADRETIMLNAGPCWIDALAMLAPEPPTLGSFRSELA